jgi:transposase
MTRRCVLHREIESVDMSFLGDQRKDSRVERRIIALRLISSGQQAIEVAKIVGVDERTVRVWVANFNRTGVESLRYARHPGPRSHLTSAQEEELAEAIRRGPPPEMKIEVWRGWAVREWVQKKFAVSYCESGIYSVLHRLGFSSLMPRPFHPDSDPEAQEEFKKNFPDRFVDAVGRASCRKNRSMVSG